MQYVHFAQLVCVNKSFSKSYEELKHLLDQCQFSIYSSKFAKSDRVALRLIGSGVDNPNAVSWPNHISLYTYLIVQLIT